MTLDFEKKIKVTWSKTVSNNNFNKIVTAFRFSKFDPTTRHDAFDVSFTSTQMFYQRHHFSGLQSVFD